MATNRGKIHGGKSVLNVHVASGEFGEITRGETTRFYCIVILYTAASTIVCIVCVCVCVACYTAAGCCSGTVFMGSCSRACPFSYCYRCLPVCLLIFVTALQIDKCC